MAKDYVFNTGIVPGIYAHLYYTHKFTSDQVAYAESHWNASCCFSCAIYLSDDPSLTRADMIAKLKADGFNDIEAEDACDENGL